MKTIKLTALLLSALMAASVFASCTGKGSGTETETGTAAESLTETPTEAPTEEPTAAPIDPATLGEPTGTYETSRGSTLTSYAGATEESYYGARSYASGLGYRLYTEGNLNGILAATYQKEGEVMHIYYVPGRNELNIAHDPVNGLPVQDEVPPTGDYKTSVTQLSAAEINGMGYIIHLSDGTFIVVDGGYATNSRKLWSELIALNGGSEEGIRIRMWILSHAHDDHFPCLRDFVRRGLHNGAQIDCVAFCPVSKKDEQKDFTADFFSSENFEKMFAELAATGTTLCTLHTGMTFTFSNVEMEMLMTADEMYIDGPHGNYNTSSTVCRVRDKESGKTLMLLADANVEEAVRMKEFYGDYLKSDMCQAAHHGVEDFPLEVYNIIQPSILFYPCSQDLYDMDGRDSDVRKALRESPFVKEVLVRGKNVFTRYFDEVE